MSDEDALRIFFNGVDVEPTDIPTFKTLTNASETMVVFNKNQLQKIIAENQKLKKITYDILYILDSGNNIEVDSPIHKELKSLKS